MEQPGYTREDFRTDVQRQLIKSAVTALSDAKLEWTQVAPILDAARALCRDDLRFSGRLALHGVEYAGVGLAPSDEAYLSLSVRDRDSDLEWLSQTWWLSDIALADQDPERVRAAVAAMERSLERLRDWLAAREQGAEPPPEAGEGSQA